MAHTPGPYIIAEPGGPAGPFYGLVNDKGNVIAMQILRRDDAVLWVAATDLLAACKALAEADEHASSPEYPDDAVMVEWDAAFDKLYAAIAKAEPPTPAVARRQGE